MTGSNRRPSACKADALPAELILRVKKMGRMMGFEPTHDGATIRCVNRFTTFAIFYKSSLAGVVGIEPTSTVLETAALPLNYTPIVLIYYNKCLINKQVKYNFLLFFNHFFLKFI